MKQYISPESPEPAADETELFRGRTRNRMFLIGGIILTFIPPFVWGPLGIFIYYYTKRRTAIILTDRRVIVVMPRYKGFRVSEIQLKDVLGVTAKRDLIDNIIGGSGDLNIRHADEDGPRYLMFPDCEKAQDVRRRILEAAGMNP